MIAAIHKQSGASTISWFWNDACAGIQNASRW